MTICATEYIGEINGQHYYIFKDCESESELGIVLPLNELYPESQLGCGDPNAPWCVPDTDLAGKQSGTQDPDQSGKIKLPPHSNLLHATQCVAQYDGERYLCELYLIEKPSSVDAGQKQLLAFGREIASANREHLPVADVVGTTSGTLRVFLDSVEYDVVLQGIPA